MFLVVITEVISEEHNDMLFVELDLGAIVQRDTNHNLHLFREDSIHNLVRIHHNDSQTSVDDNTKEQNIKASLCLMSLSNEYHKEYLIDRVNDIKFEANGSEEKHTDANFHEMKDDKVCDIVEDHFQMSQNKLFDHF